MDIFILRDGEEIGPFGKETTQTLLSQGSVAENDLAWRPGMADWVPLSVIFNSWDEGSDASPEGANPPGALSPAADSANAQEEAATPKQKAFLTYLGINIPETLTKQQAAVHLNDAMEDTALAPRVGKWNEDRLRLHPDLFAAEIHARRENRANHFFDVCQTEGAEYFPKITKAHCQVLVGFLDVKFPSWDARMENAAKDYFYPAIAEKFPQLIDRHWRGRFHYAEASHATPPPTRRQARRPTRPMAKKPVSPVVAIVRGLVAGAVILGALYLGQRFIPPWLAKRSAEKEASAATPAAAVQKAVEGKEGVASATQAQNTNDAGKEEETQGKAPRKKKKKADSVASTSAPATTRSTTGENASPPGSVASVAPQSGNAAADPSMAAAPPAPVPTAPADPTMAAAPPAPDSGMAPGTAPAAGDAAAVAKTNLVLTKPVELQMTYGKIKLPVGTAVKLVSREAAMVKVNYQNTVMMLPASSTDIDSGAGAPGGAAPNSPAPPAPAPN